MQIYLQDEFSLEIAIIIRFFSQIVQKFEYEMPICAQLHKVNTFGLISMKLMSNSFVKICFVFFW